MTKIGSQVVDSTQPGDKPVLIWDGELKGFHVRVSKNGVKAYGLFYRNSAGKQRWLTLGRHGALTPHEARTLAKKRLGEIADGGDPAADKRAKREAALEAQGSTFEVVAKRFLADRTPELRKATAHLYTVCLNRAPATWQAKPVGDISRKDVLAFLDVLKAAGKHPMAELSLRVLSVFFGWCLNRELVSILHTNRIRLTPLKSRERVLSIAELRRVWTAADRLDAIKGGYIKLLIPPASGAARPVLCAGRISPGSTPAMPRGRFPLRSPRTTARTSYLCHPKRQPLSSGSDASDLMCSPWTARDPCRAQRSI
jgi:hypothetical protein